MPTVKSKKNKLRLGVPGRALREQFLELLRMAGYNVDVSDSGHKMTVDDPEIDCFLSKTQELATWVENGMLDAAVVQRARLLEQNIKAEEIAQFNFGNGIWDLTRVVLSVPRDSKIKSLKDLQGGEVVSRLPNLTKKFLKEKGISAKVIHVSYPGEAKAEMFNRPLVDFTNTGRTLAEHNLVILAQIMTTAPVLIMNKEAAKDKWKREKMENLAMLLQGARLAKDMVGLILHASNEIMGEVLRILPAMKKPTVTQLRGEDTFDILTVINKKQARELVPYLKKIGATDIVEFPLEKVII